MGQKIERKELKAEASRLSEVVRAAVAHEG